MTYGEALAALEAEIKRAEAMGESFPQGTPERLAVNQPLVHHISDITALTRSLKAHNDFLEPFWKAAAEVKT